MHQGQKDNETFQKLVAQEREYMADYLKGKLALSTFRSLSLVCTTAKAEIIRASVRRAQHHKMRLEAER